MPARLNLPDKRDTIPAAMAGASGGRNLTEGERLEAIIALHDYARQRFREIESNIWRVDFSIWALSFGALYAFLRPDLLKGEHFGPWARLAWIVPAFHIAFLVLFHTSSNGWRAAADRYRTEALKIVRIADPDKKLVTRGRRVKDGLLLSDWIWIVLEATITVAAAGAVVRYAW